MEEEEKEEEAGSSTHGGKGVKGGEWKRPWARWECSVRRDAETQGEEAEGQGGGGGKGRRGEWWIWMRAVARRT